ncbi:hypothetical protein ASPBRDRAFT_569652 [Aspergillus brasiliensis CBS 101740]|uniref:Uncharacterized protein n=1 Tax=Aspergillus brasiliensis (strain CBS 101740 / IMI 381727 / IBT 21946) TaxID=767769 RepID=A0A1L9UIZ6_ASPBC|nr:hypothetical protein ASPBRDRAFT_569652 [Aspergillus brasiliensis CBS 101740]
MGLCVVTPLCAILFFFLPLFLLFNPCKSPFLYSWNQFTKPEKVKYMQASLNNLILYQGSAPLSPLPLPSVHLSMSIFFIFGMGNEMIFISDGSEETSTPDVPNLSPSLSAPFYTPQNGHYHTVPTEHPVCPILQVGIDEQRLNSTPNPLNQSFCPWIENSTLLCFHYTLSGRIVYDLSMLIFHFQTLYLLFSSFVTICFSTTCERMIEIVCLLLELKLCLFSFLSLLLISPNFPLLSCSRPSPSASLCDGCARCVVILSIYLFIHLSKDLYLLRYTIISVYCDHTSC